MPEQRPRVVVTGGAGFIGSHLVDSLLAESQAEVVVLDNFHRGRLANLAQHDGEPRLRVIQGDVRDADAVTAVVRDANLVFHMAAQATVIGGFRDVDYTFNTNVVGTYNVLRAAARQRVKRVVFASSREVYGEPISLPVDEDSPLAAINSYGASKAAGEMLCRAFRREFGLDSVILRLANVYGPRDFDRVIPLWFNRAMARQDLEVYGGKQVVDFVWVGQVVKAFLRASAADVTMPPVNIGSGTGTRIIDLARRIIRLINNSSHVKIVPARPMEVTRFIAKVERMQELLHLEPSLDPLSDLVRLVPAHFATSF